MIPLCVAVILDLLRSRMPRRHGAMVESLVRTEPCGATWGKQETSLLLTRHHPRGPDTRRRRGQARRFPPSRRLDRRRGVGPRRGLIATNELLDGS